MPKFILMKGKRILLIIISILIGALFLYSAYTKAEPIQRFEYTMVEFLHVPWLLAALAARFMVGLEAGIGVLFLINIYGSGKWVIKAAIGLLLVLSAYLVYLWAAFGNNVNCGCFGDAIWMSPSASLIKNGVLLLVMLAVLQWGDGLQFKWARLSVFTVVLVFISLPFILYGFPSGKPSWLKNSGYFLDLKPLYTKEKQEDIPIVDLSKGKHIIAFLSPFCPHCRMAAYKMHLIHQENPAIPFFLVIGGSRDLTDFWKATSAQDIGCARLDATHFFQIVGGEVPFIVWVNNGRVEAKADYTDLDKNVIEDWLKKP